MMTYRLKRGTAVLVSLLLILWMQGFGQQPAAKTPENNGRRYTFFPGGLLMPPPAASYHEPRVGVRKENGTSRLKLDIGSAVDIVEVRLSDDGKQKLRMGIQFFTYALTTSFEGLRLQVDATDGFFGGHILYHHDNTNNPFDLRFRFMHQSAHLIDGHFDKKTNTWKDGKEPLPYARDYGELIGSYTFSESAYRIRVYSGISYATLVRPRELKRLSTIHGFEIHNPELLGDIAGLPSNLFLANNLTISGIPEYFGTNNLEFGVKFGRWTGTGLKLYLNWYYGLDVFSQFYSSHVNIVGLGFSFDFW